MHICSKNQSYFLSYSSCWSISSCFVWNPHVKGDNYLNKFELYQMYWSRNFERVAALLSCITFKQWYLIDIFWKRHTLGCFGCFCELSCAPSTYTGTIPFLSRAKYRGATGSITFIINTWTIIFNSHVKLVIFMVFMSENIIWTRVVNDSGIGIRFRNRNRNQPLVSWNRNRNQKNVEMESE